MTTRTSASATSPSSQRRHYLKAFHRKAQLLLTDDDRDYLYHVLKEYQTYKQVDKLVQCLRSALDTPQKLDLLREIRPLIPKSHLTQFDRLAPYHKMAHPVVLTNHRHDRRHHTVAHSKPKSRTPINGKLLWHIPNPSLGPP